MQKYQSTGEITRSLDHTHLMLLQLIYATFFKTLLFGTEINSILQRPHVPSFFRMIVMQLASVRQSFAESCFHEHSHVFLVLSVRHVFPIRWVDVGRAAG